MNLAAAFRPGRDTLRFPVFRGKNQKQRHRPSKGEDPCFRQV
jgi:hypothetical protein